MRKNTSIYAFIAPFLNESDEVIKEAKKKFYREYRASWRNRQRKETKQFTVIYTLGEYRELKKESKKVKQSITSFIKAAAKAYMDSCFLFPDMEVLLAISGK